MVPTSCKIWSSCLTTVSNLHQESTIIRRTLLSLRMMVFKWQLPWQSTTVAVRVLKTPRSALFRCTLNHILAGPMALNSGRLRRSNVTLRQTLMATKIRSSSRLSPSPKLTWKPMDLKWSAYKKIWRSTETLTLVKPTTSWSPLKSAIVSLGLTVRVRKKLIFG